MPAGLEILDPDLIRQRYVEPMVELRKAKGLTPQSALAQLEDAVVLGTVIPSLLKAKEWGITTAGATTVATLGLVGMVVGGLGLGFLHDDRATVGGGEALLELVDDRDQLLLVLLGELLGLLDPGEDVTTPSTPDSGSTYEPFQYRTLLQIGAALGVPYGYLTGDTAKENFSNTRIALVDFRRRISAFQHSVMVYQLCRAVWTRWMDMAVLAGAIDLPGYATDRRAYLACDWLPTKWDWIDPAKDASAEILQIEAGLKSRTRAPTRRTMPANSSPRLARLTWRVKSWSKKAL